MLAEPPEHFFITAGAAEGITSLNAFDGALQQAGIGQYNLIKVTSIAPPNSVRTDSIDVKAGTVVPTAFASISSSKPGEIISAAVSVAVPKDRSKPGMIMEHSAKASKAEVEETVRKMAVQGMNLRGYEIGSLESAAVDHRVAKTGCVIAAVLLW
jgi:arginine decarboxylase